MPIYICGSFVKSNQIIRQALFKNKSFLIFLKNLTFLQVLVPKCKLEITLSSGRIPLIYLTVAQGFFLCENAFSSQLYVIFRQFWPRWGPAASCGGQRTAVKWWIWRMTRASPLWKVTDPRSICRAILPPPLIDGHGLGLTEWSTWWTTHRLDISAISSQFYTRFVNIRVPSGLRYMQYPYGMSLGGPPWSGSGSFLQQEKNKEKPWFLLCIDFLITCLSLKTDANVSKKSTGNKKNKFEKKLFFVGSWKSMTKRAGSWSAVKCTDRSIRIRTRMPRIWNNGFMVRIQT